jgi:tRNA wybutosine-synthesizing protein 2
MLDDTNVNDSQTQQPRKIKKKRLPTNPLTRGIVAFCHKHDQLVGLSNEDATSQAGSSSLSVSDLPKRYTAYPPLLLLPFNFPSHSGRWAGLYDSLNERQKTELFRSISQEGFRKNEISRVAINAPIAAEVDEDDAKAGTDRELRRSRENILRSPSGLSPVYGDWGPMLFDSQHDRRIMSPTTDDFTSAFWTSTSQHENITQVWAPLYTMFSRGNLSEKARVLGLQSTFAGMPHDLTDQQDLRHTDVVDFYVGIGYFAFSYLKRGVRRVFGWDINPWSIEGLRRGCERNGWRCLVIRTDDNGTVLNPEEGVDQLIRSLRDGDADGRPDQVVRCVAVLGDNKWASELLKEVRAQLDLNIRHANLGLLPTSKASWRDAAVLLAGMSGSGEGGWLHIHENVNVVNIEGMTGQIVHTIRSWTEDYSGRGRFEVSCVHVERVKTYAPGVMHCVFDVQIKLAG